MQASGARLTRRTNRPDRCKHLTACSDPFKESLASKGGVHRCSACNFDPQYQATSIAYRADWRATHAPNNRWVDQAATRQSANQNTPPPVATEANPPRPYLRKEGACPTHTSLCGEFFSCDIIPTLSATYGCSKGGCNGRTTECARRRSQGEPLRRLQEHRSATG